NIVTTVQDVVPIAISHRVVGGIEIVSIGVIRIIVTTNRIVVPIRIVVGAIAVLPGSPTNDARCGQVLAGVDDVGSAIGGDNGSGGKIIRQAQHVLNRDCVGNDPAGRNGIRVGGAADDGVGVVSEIGGGDRSAAQGR